MAFHSSVLRNGTWVTETVDLKDVIKGNTSSSQPTRQRATKAPRLGLLTRNVVESPIANWMTPVQLRSTVHNDVAFIGDRHVEILELQKDGRLQSIAKKNDFGSRIRNVKPIGLLPSTIKDEGDDGVYSTQVKTEDDDDVVMDELPWEPTPIVRDDHLPPQMLLLVLESGDCVFLFLRTGRDGQPEFVTTVFKGPRDRFVTPGFHMAVDPSSRYVALGCADGLFVVFELESMETMNERYRRGQHLRPFKTFRPRPVQGVIHKMEFLYPRPADDYHVILLLIVVKNEKSRMVTYEWEAGDHLKTVLAQEKHGHRLPVEYQMPLLVIPLTVRTAFFAISSDGIAVCKDALQGPPDFEDFQMKIHETSQYHHGIASPIWTAWTRPYRLSSWTASRDSIYLAREDGVVMFLDIDSDNILGASVNVGNFECNIVTAFCALSDNFTDILIMGGDSGPGAIWQVPPREPPKALGTIPNWSPATDFVTTDPHASNHPRGETGIVAGLGHRKEVHRAADKIFVATGKGITGSVTEYRHGLEARIGLDLDYQAPVREAWMFPANLDDGDEGYHILLSLPDRSAILHVPNDFTNASEPDPDELNYDLSGRTLLATQLSDGVIVQITENYIIIFTSSQCVRCLHVEMLQGASPAVIHAAVHKNWIALATYGAGKHQVHVLEISDSMETSPVRVVDIDADITCLSVGELDGAMCVFAGLWAGAHSSLAIFRASGSEETRYIQLDTPRTGASEASNSSEEPSPAVHVEAPKSILALQRESGKTLIVVGTRSGEIYNLLMDQGEAVSLPTTEKYGQTAAHCVSVNTDEAAQSIFIHCDTKLVLASGLDETNGQFRTKNWVWPIDLSDAHKPSLAIDSVTVLRHNLFGHGAQKQQLLLVSGSNILLAELESQPTSVPRSIPLGGTPTKMLYMPSFDCLVVALQAGDRAVLKFIDPTSGEDLSSPCDKNRQPVEFISGLGKVGDRILGLSEWEYKKDSKVWRFILVSTRDGRLLVVSMEKAEKLPEDAREKIRFWTRYKRSETGPIFSVFGDTENLFFCAGTTLHWDILDLVDKKFKPMKTFELRSPAVAIHLSGGKVIALTNNDSVQIIDTAADAQDDPMSLAHIDPASRNAVHLIETCSGSKDPDASILLVADRACGVTALWVPWQQPTRLCQVLFEAELPTSIKKFARGKTRPSWQQTRRQVRYGRVPSTADDANILGVCMDGSMYHFTLLGAEIWAVLHLVQSLAEPIDEDDYDTGEDDEEGGEEEEEDRDGFGGGTAEIVPEDTFDMHIDGDVLQRCRDGRQVLGDLFRRPRDAGKLVRLLDALDGGKWTESLRGRRAGDSVDVEGPGAEVQEYIGLLERILEYYLAPVI